MKTLAFTLLASGLFISNIRASILPPNGLQIPSGVTETGLTFEQYNNVIDRVEAIYRKEIEDRGIKFTVNRLWDDPKVNAGTYKAKDEWVVNLYGGYARHPLVTEDSYMMVFCHELGHHMGGTPRKIFSSTKLPGWPSTEGQSDYFASLKCLRRIFEKEDNAEIIAKMDVPEILSEKCHKAFTEKNEINICIRTGMAGLATASISSSVGSKKAPEFGTEDKNVVEKTYEGHPASQCRLDTYFQGALCEVPYDQMLSSKDETKGTCHQDNGHTEGLRPTCWFKPTLLTEQKE